MFFSKFWYIGGISLKIIISPAKKMKQDIDTLPHHQYPYFLKDTEIILAYMKQLSYEEIKKIWNCSDKIAKWNYTQLHSMNLYQKLTPAIFSYEGIQYQYMAPSVFETETLNYIEQHVRILSGFYGILKPFDGVVPYRLEMQAKSDKKTLYEFWGKKLAEYLFQEDTSIINLASREYSKCISKYLRKDISFLTCIFGEREKGRIIQKGTHVKMARGEMVRFMAEHQIDDIEKIKKFNRLGYRYIEELSNRTTYVFLKNV